MPPIIIPIGSNPLVNAINAAIQASDGQKGESAGSGSGSSGSGSISGAPSTKPASGSDSVPPTSMDTWPASMDTVGGLSLIA